MQKILNIIILLVDNGNVFYLFFIFELAQYYVYLLIIHNNFHNVSILKLLLFY